jgi:hypothetical protein
MSRDYFADAFSGCSARVNCTSNSGDISTHDRGHQTGIDLFPADETNVRRFYHCVGSFNHRHETTTFDHSQCFRHQLTSSEK